MAPNKGSGPQFGETVNISKVNGAKKVKSDAQVAMNNNSDTVQKFFFRMAGEDSGPTENFSNFWNCPKRVELGSSYSGSRLI